jgi:hypothetical protein
MAAHANNKRNLKIFAGIFEKKRRSTKKREKLKIKKK